MPGSLFPVAGNRYPHRYSNFAEPRRRQRPTRFTPFVQDSDLTPGKEFRYLMTVSSFTSPPRRRLPGLSVQSFALRLNPSLLRFRHRASASVAYTLSSSTDFDQGTCLFLLNSRLGRIPSAACLLLPRHDVHLPQASPSPEFTVTFCRVPSPWITRGTLGLFSPRLVCTALHGNRSPMKLLNACEAFLPDGSRAF